SSGLFLDWADGAADHRRLLALPAAGERRDAPRCRRSLRQSPLRQGWTLLASRLRRPGAAAGLGGARPTTERDPCAWHPDRRHFRTAPIPRLLGEMATRHDAGDWQALCVDRSRAGRLAPGSGLYVPLVRLDPACVR